MENTAQYNTIPYEMTLNPETTHPSHPPQIRLPTPSITAPPRGRSPHWSFPPSPRSSQTCPAADSSVGSFPYPGVAGGVNRYPSNSSRDASPAPGSPVNEQRGFREISDYMSRDGDCVLLRRFGILRFRDMLSKQAQVEEVERQLSKADRAALSGNVEEVKKLMNELDIKLKAYDDALERCHRCYTMPRPSARSLRRVNTWLRIRGFPENSGEDIIALDPGLVTDGLMTRFAALIARRVFKKEVTRKAGVDQLPTDRAVLVSRALISIAAPLILLVPVILLCYLNSLWKQIVIVVLATVTSSLAMMVAKAGNAEVFMATSAYAAVMVVFLGSVANVAQRGGAKQVG